jgi:hypothetical protein
MGWDFGNMVMDVNMEFILLGHGSCRAMKHANILLYAIWFSPYD